MEQEKAKKVIEIYIAKLDELYEDTYSDINQSQILIMLDVINILRKEFDIKVE
jgi:hypothetical protein